MGDVWEAQDTALARRVAVKILKPSANAEDAELARTRFIREARVAAALRHPNIVVAHDVGEIDGTCFFVMELVEGRPLRSLLGERIGIEERLRWLREMADALAAMHEAGVIHRDVKPENVIIRTNGSACLVDLGIAKWMRPDTAPVTLRHAEPNDLIVGTPDYLPPETCYAGFFDDLGDQYAWAITAYELLASAHPSEVLDRPLADRNDIPSAIAHVVDRARSRLPASRFPTMRALCNALGPPAARASDQPIIIDLHEDAESQPRQVDLDDPPDTLSNPPPPPRRTPRAGPTPKMSLVIGAALVTLVMHALLLALAHRDGRTDPAKAVPPVASAPPPVITPDAFVEKPAVAVASNDPTAAPLGTSSSSLRGPLRLGDILVDSSYADDQKSAFIAQNRSAFGSCVAHADSICHVYRYIVECKAHADGRVDECDGGMAGPRVRGALDCQKLATCLARATRTRVMPSSSVDDANAARSVSFEIKLERVE